MKQPLLLALAIVSLPSAALAQAKAAPMSKAARISNAASAAPPSISAKATIMDFPAAEGGKPVELRKGSNGWVCFPDIPETDGNDPMCLDASWQQWMDAYMAKRPPRITKPGIAYMTAPGGASGSNTDPFATRKAADNEWGFDGPHLMMLVTDPAALRGLPTKRQKDAPWVMWAGTPYAHIMVPVKK
ncbi:MAG TPA: hypothetical protein VFQ38_10325 [Longimicrobiales bacterium]|nr:hypothetical protein [Longimicrobiales bacterium]